MHTTQTWADAPYLVNEVFHKKLEEFKDYVLGKKKRNREGTVRVGGKIDLFLNIPNLSTFRPL